jgi:hypothetical protein
MVWVWILASVKILRWALERVLECEWGATPRWGSVGGSRGCGSCLVVIGLVHRHSVRFRVGSPSYHIVVACYSAQPSL